MSGDVEHAVGAIRSDGLAVIPTDTVYGLACTASGEAPARRLYALKGRATTQPTALVARSVDELLESVPELHGDPAVIVRALLPGPYTLVLPNPATRFRWITGSRPTAIGVRVPLLDGAGRDILDAVGALVATSANLPGGPDPRRLDEVPAQIIAAVDAAVDGGELSGIPSTVIDLTGAEPVVLREGAVPTDKALARAAAAVQATAG